MKANTLVCIAVGIGLYGCAATPSESLIPQGVETSTLASEMPSWQIPNLPAAAEAYYAPDSRHLIAQVRSDDAIKSARGMQGFLTWTFAEDGTNIRQVNDRGWDACSYYFPGQQKLVWTSVRDNLDMPLGNWSDSKDYPQGAEIYTSDLNGNNVQRLTENQQYDAEVSVSPNGDWLVFGRQIDGRMDLWRMRPDGTDQEQITFTPEWQEGAPFYLPDGETIMFRAWRRADVDKSPTPMTVFTIRHDGTQRTQRTFDDDMNWAPYPAPDGRHYVFVRVVGERNWEVFLGDLEGGEPRRLTFDDGFDGFPSLSPDGTKMVWTSSRSTGMGFRGLRLHVMDVRDLNLGPSR